MWYIRSIRKYKNPPNALLQSDQYRGSVHSSITLWNCAKTSAAALGLSFWLNIIVPPCPTPGLWHCQNYHSKSPVFSYCMVHQLSHSAAALFVLWESFLPRFCSCSCAHPPAMNWNTSDNNPHPISAQLEMHNILINIDFPMCKPVLFTAWCALYVKTWKLNIC